jgi:signal transduction histidine kinase
VVRVTGDPTKLRQAVMNVRYNVVRHSTEGGDSRVSVAADAGRVGIVARVGSRRRRAR